MMPMMAKFSNAFDLYKWRLVWWLKQEASTSLSVLPLKGAETTFSKLTKLVWKLSNSKDLFSTKPSKWDASSTFQVCCCLPSLESEVSLHFWQVPSHHLALFTFHFSLCTLHIGKPVAAKLDEFPEKVQKFSGNSLNLAETGFSLHLTLFILHHSICTLHFIKRWCPIITLSVNIESSACNRTSSPFPESSTRQITACQHLFTLTTTTTCPIHLHIMIIVFQTDISSYQISHMKHLLIF